MWCALFRDLTNVARPDSAHGAARHITSEPRALRGLGIVPSSSLANFSLYDLWAIFVFLQPNAEGREAVVGAARPASAVSMEKHIG